nr:hypothetical protein [Deltaproteobacteria bacterium]
MAHPEQSAADLCALRDRAKGAVAAELDAHCASYTFYEYDQPLLFASYWDWAAPARGRIHVSSGVWGMNVARTPGVDHLRLTEPPSAAYSDYVQGLENLRKVARVLQRDGTEAFGLK